MRTSAVLLAMSAGLGWVGSASAYIGDSFLSVPDASGHWRGRDHKGWIRAEASEWLGRLPRMNSGSSDILNGEKLFFGGPNAPKPGNFGRIAIALNKANPDLPLLMGLCASKAVVPAMSYAEQSDRARPLLELGPRPADLPAFWEYRLKDVQVVGCPVAEGAEQQALILAFKDIEWLNYDPARPAANPIRVSPEAVARVQPARATPRKAVRSFLITWIAPATDAPDGACPTMNAKPTEADIFRYFTPEEAAKVRAQNGEKGISYGTQSENRGPGRLSVANFPGIVPPPVYHEPQTTVSEGVDLDGDDGSGAPPPGIRKHANFTAKDGRTGIDNQYMRVWACVPGYRGKRGYNNQTPNARRADGNITTIIEVSDIDDERNDSLVYVSFIHSMDKPIRDNAGQTFIPGYSFRTTDNPDFALFNVRLRGRIKDGVITTDPVPQFDFNPGQGTVTTLYKAQVRLEPRPDGSVKGYLGGYQDWRRLAYSGYSEGLFGFQAPGVYYSLKRNADGLRDPVTGEYNGISTILEIDTVPAFITPAAPSGTATVRAGSTGRTSR